MAFPRRAEGALSFAPTARLTARCWRPAACRAVAAAPRCLLRCCRWRPAACRAVAAGALQPAAAPRSLPRCCRWRPAAGGAVEPARHRERSRTGQRTLLPGSGARALEGRLALISTKMDRERMLALMHSVTCYSTVLDSCVHAQCQIHFPNPRHSKAASPACPRGWAGSRCGAAPCPLLRWRSR